jgi:tetratricopeptide (TPR) repeat protein
MKKLLLMLALVGVAHADSTLDSTFQRGNEAWLKGRYAEAIEAYEHIAASGVRSADVFYNLANAYAKTGRLGPAIYNYERALALDPGQEDVQFNLRAARDAVRKLGEDRLVGEDKAPWWVRTVESYTVGGLGWVFLVVYLLLFALLITLHFVGPGFLRVGLQALLGFAVLGALVSGVFLGARIYLAERVQQAVVLPDSLPVKEGPAGDYTSSFSVHAGLKLVVIEKDQDWLRVRLGNGLEGWVREQDIGRL